MVKLEFTNAVVTDRGYGLQVNEKWLSDLITTAVGAKVKGFKSNCCNITVIIDPQPVSTSIEDDTSVFNSVKEMEEYYDGLKAEDAKTDTEE